MGTFSVSPPFRVSDFPATISALSEKDIVVQVAPPRVNVADEFESIESALTLVALSAFKLVAPVAVKATTFVVPAVAVREAVDTLAAVSACTSVDPHVNVPAAMLMVEEASPRSVNVRPAAPTKRLPVELAPSAMRTIVSEDRPVARFNVPLAV